MPVRHWLALGAAGILVALCVPGQPEKLAAPGTLKAVIVDALSAADPNATFVASVRSLLAGHGYDVAYYPASEANVSLFSRLPSLRPDVLVLRTHSAVDRQFVGLFTAEPFNRTEHRKAFLQGTLAPATTNASGFPSGDRGVTAAITPLFLDTWTSDLPGSLVVAMGCDTLTMPSLAQAFLANGARAFVGWDGAVDGGRSDKGALLLLHHMLDSKESVRQALAKTAAELGPDPDSTLQRAGEGGLRLAVPASPPPVAGPLARTKEA